MTKALEAAALALARKNFPDRKWVELTDDQKSLYLEEAGIAIRAFAENVTDEMALELFEVATKALRQDPEPPLKIAVIGGFRAAILRGIE